jgi:hypothetical protein
MSHAIDYSPNVRYTFPKFSNPQHLTSLRPGRESPLRVAMGPLRHATCPLIRPTQLNGACPNKIQLASRKFLNWNKICNRINEKC